MSPTPRTVRLVRDESSQLRSAMHDIQFSVWQYYRHTTWWPDHRLLTTPARSTVAFIQKLHDVFSADASDGGIKNSATYNQIYERRLKHGDPGTETIEAFKYLRNVGQHLVFPVDPDPGPVFGGLHGMRSYNPWAFVPIRADNRLRPATRRLRPMYRRRLEGQNITDTFLIALGFFAAVCPRAVHHSGEHDEWTWFPLRDQPGVDRPLLPDEPSRAVQAMRWLCNRKPGGDLRVMAGQLTLGGQPRLVGLTFAANRSFGPFVETHAQVQRDIDMGYPYHNPARMPPLEAVPRVIEVDGSSRPGFQTAKPIRDLLPEPLREAPPIGSNDWTNLGDSPEALAQLRWTCVEGQQAAQDLPDEPFLVYRCRRLYAHYPIL